MGLATQIESGFKACTSGSSGPKRLTARGRCEQCVVSRVCCGPVRWFVLEVVICPSGWLSVRIRMHKNDTDTRSDGCHSAPSWEARWLRPALHSVSGGATVR